MSDNIDYDELDKAVNAAINARNAAKSQPKPEPKTEAESSSDATKKSTTKPTPRGVMIDFVPRHSTKKDAPVRPVAKKPTIKPVAKPTLKPVNPHRTTESIIRKSPVSQPVKKPVAAPAPIRRLAARPAVKPVTKTVAKPTIAPARAISKPLPTRPVAKPAPKPAATPEPKPVTKPEPKPVLDEKPTPILKKRETPNANNYSIGGHSPFIKNTKVEKRPLGKNTSDSSASSLRSTHNVYSQKSPIRTTENTKKHIITQEPQKKSGWISALLVLGIIAAGGALGWIAFLIFFAK